MLSAIAYSTWETLGHISRATWTSALIILMSIDSSLSGKLIVMLKLFMMLLLLFFSQLNFVQNWDVLTEITAILTIRRSANWLILLVLRGLRLIHSELTEILFQFELLFQTGIMQLEVLLIAWTMLHYLYSWLWHSASTTFIILTKTMLILVIEVISLHLRRDRLRIIRTKNWKRSLTATAQSGPNAWILVLLPIVHLLYFIYLLLIESFHGLCFFYCDVNLNIIFN